MPFPQYADSYRLVATSPAGASSSGGDRSTLGLILLILGILMVVGGIGLLAAASFVSSGVSSFNQVCSMNPSCVPESDPSGGLTVGGAVLLVLGGVLSIGGYVMYSGRR
jgi:hypothetical protein